MRAELKETLLNLKPDMAVIESYWKQSNINQEYKTLKEKTEHPDFWKHKDQASIMQQLQHMKVIVDAYHTITSSYIHTSELLELFQDNDPEIKTLAQDITKLKQEVKQFKLHILLQDPQDSSACFLTINAGAGGTESQDWANMLLRMYTRFCEQNKLKSKIIDIQNADDAGIKSATLYIKGSHPFGLLKTEAGIHRLVRISPFDSNKRRHTSFVAVHVSAEIPDIEITIDQKDLRIDTYRASGAGGQHVNTTDSAVRITHIPSGIVVQCQNERSQFQNKETALKMLKSRLAEKQKQEKEKDAAATEKRRIEWGSQIRSYILHPYKLVKDHRTNVEHQQPDLVLDGDIMNFIQEVLIQQSTQ